MHETLSYNPNAYRSWSKKALKPFAALLAASAFLGCSSDKSQEESDRFIPPIFAVSATGRGDESVELKVGPPAADEKPRQLVVAVSMDCEKSGSDSIIVAAEDVINFETSICDLPQTSQVQLPPDDRLHNADTIKVKVDTSRDDLRWVVGADTTK